MLHDRVGSHQIDDVGIDPHAPDFAPGERVAVDDGTLVLLGTVDRVEPGRYHVAYDGGVGEGWHTGGELVEATEVVTAAEDYPELAGVLEEFPPPQIERTAVADRQIDTPAGYPIPVSYDPSLTNEAQNRGGKVVVGDKFFGLPPATREAVLWHELGHEIDEAALNEGWGWDVVGWLPPFGHLNGQTTPGEIVAEAYSTLQMGDQQWVIDQGGNPELFSKVADLARRKGLPLRHGTVTDTASLAPEASLPMNVTAAGWLRDKATDWIDRNVNGSPTNWCRWRSDDSQCLHAERLDGAETERQGRPHWNIVLRGHCPRDSWIGQIGCPVGEPLPDNERLAAREAPQAALEAVTAHEEPCEPCGGLGLFEGVWCQACDGHGTKPFSKEGQWSDIVAKAKRIRAEGGVHIIAVTDQHVTAEVQGDNDVYTTTIQRVPGRKQVATWECFLPDAPITMADGSERPISEVVPGDLVITHEGNVRPVVRAEPKPYSGDLVKLRFRGDSRELAATAGHEVWSANRDYGLDGRGRDCLYRQTGSTVPDLLPSRGWVRIEDLSVGDYLSRSVVADERPVIIQVPHPRGNRANGYVPLAERRGEEAVKIDLDLAWWLGWYAAEGFVVDHQIGFALGGDERSVAEELDRIAQERFGVTGSIRQIDSTHIDYRISHYALAHIARELVGSGARDKRLSAEMLTLPLPEQQRFMDAWTAGDGHVESRGVTVIHSASETLIRQGREILARLGIVANVYRSQNVGGPTHRERRFPIYNLQWSKQRPNITQFRRDHAVWHQVVERSVEHYEGEVWDIEVEGDHSFRAYGMSVHNCSCPWSTYSWGRSGPWKKYEGRVCGHALALMYEMMAEEMLGGELAESPLPPAYVPVASLQVTAAEQCPQCAEEAFFTDQEIEVDGVVHRKPPGSGRTWCGIRLEGFGFSAAQSEAPGYYVEGFGLGDSEGVGVVSRYLAGPFETEVEAQAAMAGFEDTAWGRWGALGIAKVGATSWRPYATTTFWNDHEAVITSEGGGGGRRAYEVFVGGQNVASRETLADAKAVAEEKLGGPQEWKTRRMEPVAVDHPTLGRTEVFTAPTTIWTVGGRVRSDLFVVVDGTSGQVLGDGPVSWDEAQTMRAEAGASTVRRLDEYLEETGRPPDPSWVEGAKTAAIGGFRAQVNGQAYDVVDVHGGQVTLQGGQMVPADQVFYPTWHPTLGLTYHEAALHQAREDYRGGHQPSGDYGAPMHDLTVLNGEDIYAHPEWFVGWTDYPELISLVRQARGHPDMAVTVYRAIPADVNDDINPGDWVTPSKRYAQIHGESNLGYNDREGNWVEDWKIVSRQVKARELVWPGDYGPEWGWFPNNHLAALGAVAPDQRVEVTYYLRGNLMIRQTTAKDLEDDVNRAIADGASYVNIRAEGAPSSIRVFDRAASRHEAQHVYKVPVELAWRIKAYDATGGIANGERTAEERWQYALDHVEHPDAEPIVIGMVGDQIKIQDGNHRAAAANALAPNGTIDAVMPPDIAKALLGLDVTMVEAAEAILLDEPEPALPETTGEDEDPEDGQLIDSSGESLQLKGGSLDWDSLGQVEGTLAADGERYDDQGNIVVPEPTNANLAARMERLALRDFTPAEQRELIDEEPADGKVAANLDLLDLSGTHYDDELELIFDGNGS